MKKFMWAVVAFVFILATAPAAVCDSFGNTASGVKHGSDARLNGRLTAFPEGSAESGMFPSNAGPGSSESASNGAPNTYGSIGGMDDVFFFDNLWPSTRGGASIENRGGTLIALNGHDFILYTNGSNLRMGSERVYFNDKGTYRVGNGAVKGKTGALSVTPEPGSLFLLGTGLLGLALVLFRSSARRSPSES